MTINAFNVSYPNFELDTIINPDEFDVNFADIMIRLNQIIDVINHITDGRAIENEDGTITQSDGTDIIDIGQIAPFTSTKLQLFLEELIARLNSQDAESGALFIGASPIPGVSGGTVQDLLESLKTLLDEQVAKQIADNTSINERAQIIEDEAFQLELRVSATENEIASIESGKLNKGEAYTIAQTDTEISQLEVQVYGDMYTKTQANSLLDEKVDVGSDHVGTWQGINVDDLADTIGASGVAISNTQPTSPVEKLLWFNPSNNQYTLYLNGQWRRNSAPTQIVKVHNRVVLGAESNTVNIGIENFNPEYDAFIVMQNSTFIAEGFEYTVNVEGTAITTSSVVPTGTTFDFIAFIAQPVV